jgi:hypothetical protein
MKYPWKLSKQQLEKSMKNMGCSLSPVAELIKYNIEFK